MSSPEVFKHRIENVALRIEGNVEKGLRKVALKIDSELVNSTPVDTGRARSNWLPAFDRPAEGTVPPSTPGIALATVAAKVASFDLDKNTSIHLTNNLPYIKRLDEGSSQQQPAGFVRRAITAGINGVKSVKLLRK